MEKNNLDLLKNKSEELQKMLNQDFEDINYDDIMNEFGVDIKGLEQDMLNYKPQLSLSYKKLHPDAVVPKYAKDGDAGLDLVATNIISNTTFDVTYGTGIAMEIPKGYVGLVFPRSSIRKTDLSLTNCVGVIDSGYRGEIQATFKKIFGKNDVRLDELDYNVGDRIAQIMIIPYVYIKKR